MGRTKYLEEYLHCIQLGDTSSKTYLVGHRLEAGEYELCIIFDQPIRMELIVVQWLWK